MAAECESNDGDRERRETEDRLDLLLRDGLDAGEDDGPAEDSGFGSFLERFPAVVREPVRRRAAGS